MKNFVVEKTSAKKIWLSVVISLLLAILINGNFYLITKSVIKDVVRGKGYARAEKELVPVSTGESDDYEAVVTGVDDYVQVLNISFEQPVVSHMVVQFYCGTGSDKAELKHIGDTVVYPGATQCQVEVHQFVSTIVMQEVSPDSGNVESIVSTNVKKAVVNYQYKSPLQYAVSSAVDYFSAQKTALVMRVLASFLLILAFLFLLRVDFVEKYQKHKVLVGMGVIDILIAGFFIRKVHPFAGFIAYRNAIICMGILCILAVSVAGYLLFIKKCETHKVYAVSGFLMGLVFMIALPVYQVPDEPTHLYAAYELSNWCLGEKIPEDNTIVLRQDDYEMPLQTGQFSAEDYERYYGSIFRKCHSDRMVSTDREAAQTWHYQYVMGALGITLGRLLGLGSTLTFLLGRLFSLILFVALVSYAIKCIPIGKMMMFALALLPMTVQQSMSYSYDTVLIPAVFVTVALSVKLACEKQESLTRFDYIMLCLSAAACMPPKGHAYFLIGFLPLIALLNKECRTGRKTRNIVLISGVALISLVATVLLQGRIFPNLQKIPEGYQNYIAWADAEGYTIGGLLSQPLVPIKMFFRTITGYGRFYIETFLGNRLGWLELYFSDFCLKILLFIVALSSIPRKEDRCVMQRDVSFAYKMIGLVEIMIVFAGFLLSWTPINEGTICGVQGRYFIPVAVVIFAALRGRFAKVNKWVDRPLAMASVMALCWVVYDIILTI